MTRKDLVVLAADKDMEQTLQGLLARPPALDIRPIAFDIFVHPEHDPACARRGVSFLSRFARTYDHGLLLFDHEGSGREGVSRLEIQNDLNREFAGSGWEERARAIVVSPELEAWVWSPSPHVDEVAGWRNRQPALRDWLIEIGRLREGDVKPRQPKEAFQAALRAASVARSSSLYRSLAEKVSLRSCEDASFQELRSTLREWFPQDIPEGDAVGSADRTGG